MPTTAAPAQRAVEDDELLVLNKQENENVLGSLFTLHSLLLVPRAPPIQRNDDDALTGEPDSGPDDGEPESAPDDGESPVVVRAVVAQDARHCARGARGAKSSDPDNGEPDGRVPAAPSEGAPSSRKTLGAARAPRRSRSQEQGRAGVGSSGQGSP